MKVFEKIYEKKSIFKITFTSLMIALGIILPFLTGQIPEIGAMLCPMHIPILVCGIICEYKYGAIAGLITPLLRSVLFSMPPLYPTAIAMSFELATYGCIIGILFKLFRKQNVKMIVNIYASLIIAMILGRLVWGLARYIISIFDGSNLFNINIFLSAALITAWPGIFLQLILIPTLILGLYKTKIIKY